MVMYWATFLRTAGAAIFKALADYIELGSVVWCGTSSGGSNDFDLIPEKPLDGYRDGMRFQFRAHQSNAGSPTASVASPTGQLATYDIEVGSVGNKPAPGAISSGDTITLVYRYNGGSPFFDLVQPSFRFASYTPTVVGSGSMTISALLVNYAYCMRFFGVGICLVDCTFTTGGTASRIVQFSLPSGYTASAGVGSGWLRNGGNQLAAVCYIDTSVPGFNVTLYTAGNWTLGANRRFGCFAIFRP